MISENHFVFRTLDEELIYPAQAFVIKLKRQSQGLHVPYFVFNEKERYIFNILTKYYGDPFIYLYEYEKEIVNYKSKLYISIFKFLKFLFLREEKYGFTNSTVTFVRPDYTRENVYNVLSIDEDMIQVPITIEDLEELEEEVFYRPRRKLRREFFHYANLRKNNEPIKQAIVKESNPLLLKKLYDLLDIFKWARLGKLPYKKVWDAYKVQQPPDVFPQMDGEQIKDANVMQPVPMLPTTNSGRDMFGEHYYSLKDLLRRYQLYWEGTVQIRTGVTRNQAVLQIPLVPTGLDLDVDNKETNMWNVMRDGHIPIIASGYRFFRGGLRLRIVFPHTDANVWIQHHPDKPIIVKKALVNDEIPLADRYRNHSYGFYIQSLRVNNIVQLEIPFYQPGVYGVLGDKAKKPTTDIGDYMGYGDLVIGFENSSVSYKEVDLSIYYSVADDMSFNVFTGFDGVVFTGDTIVEPQMEVDPQMEKAKGEDESVVQASNVVLGETQVESKAIASEPKTFTWSRLSTNEPGESFELFLNRYFVWKTWNWSTVDQPRGFIGVEEIIPAEILTSIKVPTYVPLVVPFKLYEYWRGDIEIKIQVNSNKFQTGQLQGSFYYGAGAMSERNFNIYSSAQRPHVLINAGACNEATLYIPYKHMRPFLHTRKRKGYMDELDIGCFYLAVLAPLRVGSETSPDNCDVTLFVRFVNCEFTGMRDGSIVTPQMESAIGMMAASSLVDKLIGDKNCDNKSDTRPPNMLVPTASNSWSIGNGLSEPVHPLRLVNVPAVGRTSDVGFNDLDIKEVCKVYGMLKHIIWKCDDKAQNRNGNKLWDVDVHPQCDKFRLPDYEGVELELTGVVMPPVGVISSLYQYWRGSIEYRFDIICSQYHTGRILIAYIPGAHDSTQITLDLARSSAHIVCSINEASSFSFVVPYIADKPWWYRRYAGPQRRIDFSAPSKLYMFILNKVVPMETVTQTITIIPYMRAGPDFEVAVPTQPSIGLMYNIKNLLPLESFLYSKAGYSPIYAGQWRELYDSVKYIFRYGEVTDHVAQFEKPKVKVTDDQVILWKANCPISSLPQIKIKDKTKINQRDIEHKWDGASKCYLVRTPFLILWYSSGYIYGIPWFWTEVDPTTIETLIALQEGKMDDIKDYLIDFVENSSYYPKNLKWKPMIIQVRAPSKYVMVEPQMFGSAIHSFAGNMMGYAGSWLMTGGMEKLGDAVEQRVTKKVNAVVTPLADKALQEMKEVKDNIQDIACEAMKDMGISVVMGQLLHCLVNPTPITVAISIVNILGAVLKVGYSHIAEMINIMNTSLVKVWDTFSGVINKVVEPQMDNHQDTFLPLLSMLFTSVCMLLGVVGIQKPNTYYNLMRDINITASLTNNILTFLKNCVGTVEYYIKYVIGLIDPKRKLDLLLESCVPDVKMWFEECDYLMNPMLNTRLMYERALVTRVFDACVVGSMLMNVGFEKNYPGAKIISDCYRDICKLRNTLIERGQHPGVRFECFPIWIHGEAGVGKSYIASDFCKRLKKSAGIKSKSPLIYYLDPAKKYWTGIADHTCIVRDDAYQMKGQLMEEELATHFAICSSSVLNPPLAQVDQKDRLINPKIYLMFANKAFPEILAASCPEAVYRRRDLMIHAELTPYIKEKYPRILSAKYLPEHEREGFKHLRFRYANNPKDPSTTYGDWMTYLEMVEIAQVAFKKHYAAEQKNFRQRMIDMYDLDEEMHDTYAFTELPEFKETLSLKERIQLMRENIEENITLLEDELDQDERWSIAHIYKRVKEGISYAKDTFGFQIGEDEEPQPGCSTQSDVNTLMSEYIDAISKRMAKKNYMYGPDVPKAYADAYALSEAEGTLYEDLYKKFNFIGLSDDTIKLMFTDYKCPIEIEDFAHCFTICHSGHIEKVGLKVASGDMPEFSVHEPLYLCDVDIYCFLYNLNAPKYIHRPADIQRHRDDPIKQLLAYMQNLFYVDFQRARIVDMYERFKYLKRDENTAIFEECMEGCDRDLSTYSTEELRVLKEKYNLFLTYCSKSVRCTHVRWWYNALKDFDSIEWCSRLEQYFKPSRLGTSSGVEECNCANSITNNRFIKHLINSLYIYYNSEKISLGVKKAPIESPSIKAYRLYAREDLLSRIVDKTKCWWHHSVTPFVSKVIDFIINILPYILDIIIRIVIIYGISLGVEKVGEWFSGVPMPEVDAQSSPNYYKWDKPATSKPTGFLPGERTFKQSSPVQRNQLKTQIENSMCLIRVDYVKDNNRCSKNARCLFLKGRQVLLLLHYVEEFDHIVKIDPNSVFSVYFNISNKTSVKILDWVRFKETIMWASIDNMAKSSNFGIGVLPKEFPLMRDITKLFAKRQEHLNVASTVDIYSIGAEAAFNMPVKKEKRYVVREQENSSAVSMDVVYTYYKQNPGMCGSIIVSNNLGKGNGAIIGMHVAGSHSTNLGVAEPIYKEMFDCFELPEKELKVMEMDLLPIDEANVDLDSNILMYGCVDKKFAHKESGKTKYRPSPVAGLIYPIKTEPNPLMPGDPRQPVGSHPLRDGCNKLGTGSIVPFDQVLVDEVFRHEKEEQIMICKPVRAEVKPLTMQQAVCGDINVPYFESLEWNTSEGFPLSSYRPSGKHNKKWLFDLEEQVDGYKLKGIDNSLKILLNLRDECFKSKVKPPTIYVDCLKDYRLPPEKCKIPGKTRIFSIAPIQSAIDFKKYTNDWCASIKQNRIYNSIAIGINPDSLEWTKLYNYLLQVGTNIITLDYSNFGPTLMSQIVAGLLDIVPSWYEAQGATKDHIERVKWLVESDILNPVHLCDNVVYQTLNGISSGSPWTGEANSVPNKCYIKIAYLSIMREKCPKYASLFSYNELVRLVVYGDDLIMSVNDDIIEYFNALTIRDFFALHGLTVTSAFKDQELTSHGDFNTASFLKRGFREHPFRTGVWLAPLEKQSIEECLNWIKDGNEPIEALKSCIISSMDMAFGQGEEYYSQHRDKILYAMRNLGEKINLKTWRERDKEIFDLDDDFEVTEADLKIKMPWYYNK